MYIYIYIHIHTRVHTSYTCVCIHDIQCTRVHTRAHTSNTIYNLRGTINITKAVAIQKAAPRQKKKT